MQYLVVIDSNRYECRDGNTTEGTMKCIEAN